MYRPVLVTFLAVSFLLVATTGESHHSRTPFNMDDTIQLQGRVVKLLWRHPHTYVDLAVADASGEEQIWVIEFESPNSLQRLGISRDAMSPGEHIEVSAHPSRQTEQRFAFGASVEFGDGREVSEDYGSLDNDELVRPTTSIEGAWFRIRPTTGGPGFNNPAANWNLTPAGHDALASYDELSEENPVFNCRLEPTPQIMHLPLIYAIEVHGDSVTIQMSGREERRTIFLGIDTHEGADDAYHGHSIGSWDDGTLVVDTRRFIPSRTGNSRSGLPSSSSKHLVERFRLSDDGRSLEYAWTLDDPVYLAEPVSYVRNYVNRPDLLESQVEIMPCDIESARRILEEVAR
jgi:hypothetical protein